MKKCSKSTTYTIILILTLFILLTLINLPNKPNTCFKKLKDLKESNYLKFLNSNVTKKNISNKISSTINTDIFFNIEVDYMLKPKCPKVNFLAVLIVTSYFGHVELRSSMRRAFSNEDLLKIKIKRVFLLGQAKDQYITQKQIENEHRRFGDILQGNFTEAYKNLTYKHLMGLNWASQCESAKYIIKMDDDIVLNLRGVVKLIQNTNFPDRLLAGYILHNMVPVREPANKWYVTQKEYPGNTYPDFLSGWFYITNYLTVKNLLRVIENERYFWIDDLFVTGILARKLRIKHFSLNKYFLTDAVHTFCCLNDMKVANLNCEYLFGPNGGDNNLFVKFNDAIKDCELKGCLNRTKSLKENCKLDLFDLKIKPVKSFVEDFRLI